MTKRRMPSARRVRQYWADVPGSGTMFGDPFLFDEEATYDYHGNLEETVCFGCGFYTRSPERAHLLARCYGGDDSAENLALLCGACHRYQPDGDREEAIAYLRGGGYSGFLLPAARPLIPGALPE